ncbi:hypothetical protein ABZ322_22755, partial [Streptomyces sp. NPDC006129]
QGLRRPVPGARGGVRRQLRRSDAGRAGGVRTPLTAYVPARAEVVVLGLVVAVSGLLTALPVPIRW